MFKSKWKQRNSILLIAFLGEHATYVTSVPPANQLVQMSERAGQYRRSTVTIATATPSLTGSDIYVCWSFAVVLHGTGTRRIRRIEEVFLGVSCQLVISKYAVKPGLRPTNSFWAVRIEVDCARWCLCVLVCNEFRSNRRNRSHPHRHTQRDAV